MTEQSSGSATEQATEQETAKQETGRKNEQPEERTVTDGRYLYCLINTTTAESETGSEQESKAGSEQESEQATVDWSTTGVDDNTVYVIEGESVGAVVHDCERIYDTESPEQVKQWVLRHQHVVDAASDVFGTPLPMRFNTILEGGDTSVTQWLHENHDTVREELTSFAGTWEYRIHLFWEPSTFEAQIEDEDDQLQELQQRQEEAGSGKSFLLKKQYDKRLRERKQNRRAELTTTLQETVRPVVRELLKQGSGSQLAEDTTPTKKEQVTRLAVLADEENETVLGDRLDEIVEQDGVSIKFTGPWPPYTFAPDLG